MAWTVDVFDGHIPLTRPYLGEEEIEAVADVMRSGWISQGPVVAQFEAEVAGRVGARFGVATNAATSALQLALRVADVESGDEVICPSFTCMATANAILLAGAVPRFADINPRTFNLDCADVAERVTPRTRALILVHQIGLPADIHPFVDFCQERGILLIEDAATAMGATYCGHPLGGHGNPTVFSFHPRKSLTTGEGGMLMLDREDWANRARMLRSAGASISDLERHHARGRLVQRYEEAGFNYRLTDIQAAIGCVQLRRLSWFLTERTRQAARYDEGLARVAEIEVPFVPPGSTHAFTSYCIRIRREA